MKAISIVAASTLLSALFAGSAFAGAIPYPNAGTPNPVIYTFTAATTGVITAYFAGSGASYDEVVGLSVNGGAPSVYGLDNHSSAIGDSLVLGSVTQGDILTFLDDVTTISTIWSSNPSSNIDGGNHVYSTSALADQAYSGSPAGTYVGFEDLNFKTGSDYNYYDNTFVFTNVSAAVPEPATWALMLLGFAGLGFAGYRQTKRRDDVALSAA